MTNESEVKGYLDANPDFLEDYVLRNIPQDTIEKWTIRKARQFDKCKILIQPKSLHINPGGVLTSDFVSFFSRGPQL